ncbi:unnamed protein product [Pylaiella littoralis]
MAAAKALWKTSDKLRNAVSRFKKIAENIESLTAHDEGSQPLLESAKRVFEAARLTTTEAKSLLKAAEAAEAAATGAVAAMETAKNTEAAAKKTAAAMAEKAHQAAAVAAQAKAAAAQAAAAEAHALAAASEAAAAAAAAAQDAAEATAEAAIFDDRRQVPRGGGSNNRRGAAVINPGGTTTTVTVKAEEESLCEDEVEELATLPMSVDGGSEAPSTSQGTQDETEATQGTQNQTEERQADILHCPSLPRGDHFLVVEELEEFAPTGCHAHSGNRRELGDELEEGGVEACESHGRTTSPSPSWATNGCGAWAATHDPQYSVDGEVTASAAEGGGRNGDEGGGGSAAEHVGGQPKAAEADHVEEFLPEFGVPEGLVPPSSVRQHMTMLEVLLGLKQPSIAAFSFLSDEDPVHPYYIFLKSWSGAALSTEYTRQQRLQAGRTEAPRRDEEQRKDRKEAGAGAGAARAAAVCAADDDDAGATDANDAKEAKEPGAIAGDTDDPDAPNLFGRACSPEDGQDSSPVSSAGPAAAAATGVSKSVAVPTAEEMLPLAVGLESAAVTPRQRDDLVAPPLVPGERTRQVVEKMVRHVTEYGKVFEDRVRRAAPNSNGKFDFLNPENQFHAYYNMRLALVIGEPACEQGNSSGAAASGGTKITTTGQGLPPAAGSTSGKPTPTTKDALPEHSAFTSCAGAASADASALPTATGTVQDQSWPQPEVRKRRGVDGAEAEAESSSGAAKIVGVNGGTRRAVCATAEPVHDATTRQAERLKRARLMTGYFKSAIRNMEYSSEQQQNQHQQHQHQQHQQHRRERATEDGGGAATDPRSAGVGDGGGAGRVGDAGDEQVGERSSLVVGSKTAHHEPEIAAMQGTAKRAVARRGPRNSNEFQVFQEARERRRTGQQRKRPGAAAV